MSEVPEGAGRAWQLHRRGEDGWELAHTHDELPVRPVDVVHGHHYTSTFPSSVPRTAHVRVTSYVSGSGKHFDLTTCTDTLSEAATTSCMKKADIVGASIDYIPISQMSSMQWLGASILFALTAGIVAFLFVWGRKRLV